MYEYAVFYMQKNLNRQKIEAGSIRSNFLETKFSLEDSSTTDKFFVAIGRQCAPHWRTS